VSRPEWIAAPLVAAAVVAAVVWSSGRLPDGPVEPRWDHERCARCGMLVSERGFAAQVQRADGRVLHYDDPGCLLSDEGAERGALADAHAVWFHHVREPRWLSFDEVGFVPAARTPMDYGLAAVERSQEPDAWSVAQALERVRARTEALP